MYQIQMATEQFGEAGKGWGWSFSEPIFSSGTVVIKCTLWHGDKGHTIEHFGQKNLEFKGKPDEDAFKKAATDGLTKCLSYLGFNADVFLGKFDDNKYVEGLKNGIEGGVLDSDMRDESKLQFLQQVNEKLDSITNSAELAVALTKEQTDYLANKLKKIDYKAYITIKERYAELTAQFKKIDEQELLDQFNRA